MKRLLTGFVIMFLSYPTGVFEWHYIIILSNIIGVCIAYSGYLSVKPLRKLHLSYPLSLYGLANLLFLALRFNNIPIEGLPLENPLSDLLSIISMIFTFFVLFYPSFALSRILRTLSMEYRTMHLDVEKELWQNVALPLMLGITFFFFVYPDANIIAVLVFVLLHIGILSFVATKWVHVIPAVMKDSSEKINK